jgi:Putative lactococcus lactis phage r1t holin
MVTPPLPAPGNPFTQGWMIGLLDRSLGTFLVTIVALIGLGQPGFDVFHVDWKAALLAALSATMLTVVKTVIAAFVGDTGTTSLLPGGK